MPPSPFAGPAEVARPAEAARPTEAAPEQTVSYAGEPPQPVVASGTASQDGASPGRIRRWRAAFRLWRRSRPFWGGFLVLLGGGEILLTYRASLGVVLHFGLGGLAGYLVPALLTLLGLLIIFDFTHRTFYSVLAVLAALGTWLTSNLGGFILGMLLGVVGGSLAFGWQPGERPARKRRRVRARATG